LGAVSKIGFPKMVASDTAISRLTFAFKSSRLASGCLVDNVRIDDINEALGINSRSDLARANRIDDPASIKPGDAIWIPGASRKKPAKTAYGKTAANADKEEAAISGNDAEKPAEYGKKGVFLWPLTGEIVSKYGNNNGQKHDGIDISARMGEPVKASASGRVIYSGDEIKGYGNMLIIKHQGPYSSVYSHNSENLVSKGSFVKAGDIIALVGDSGRSTGPMLHFEIRDGKETLDPLRFLP